MDDNRVAGAGRGARRLIGATALLALVAAGCSSSSSSDSPTTTAAAGSSSTVAGAGAVTTAPGGATAATTVTPTTVAPSGTPTSATTVPAPTSTLATTTTSTTTTVVVTTTTFPLLVQGGVVLVANASGIDGAAASVTDSLGQLGFQTVKATNAAGYERTLDTSKVYFAGEGYPTAYSIAQLLGGIPVAAMPTPPPIANALEGLRGANVIVMLGGDLAGKPVGGN